MVESGIWFILALVFIVAEVLLGGTIVLVFASLSALTVGFLTTFDSLDMGGNIQQISSFLFITIVYSVLFWAPVKKYIRSKSKKNNLDVVGQSVVIASDELTLGEIGKAEWSGTIVRAKICNTHGSKALKKGDVVTIVDIKNNIFIVKK